LSEPDLHDIVARIDAEMRPQLGRGRVADYIPALASVPIERFGIAVSPVGGTCAVAGDADEPFSIQSLSKVLTLTLALETRSDSLWTRVGKEPSGDPFNSLTQLEFERGIPRNPLINAGAIVVADCLVSDRDDACDTVLAFARRLAGDRVSFDFEVAESERAAGFRNAALANLMKGFGNLENRVETTLNAYFHQCSLTMSCRELATGYGFLAADGMARGTEVVTPARARRINALMLTCGTYDRAGEFAYEVGLPAKSGVGGGIVAVVPDRGTVAVWSPGLGPSGNSALGIEALKRFVALTGWSVF